MRIPCIETERLELVHATLEMVQAEADDRAKLAAMLGAAVPRDWPPEFNDADTLAFTLRKLQECPEQEGWWYWYFVLKDGVQGGRTLIGNGGYKGPPDGEGNVEIGYAVLEKFQKRGYGSEAAGGLVARAFDEGVQSVTAETLPELYGSIRVLEKNGFVFMGEGSEPGVIWYRKDRA